MPFNIFGANSVSGYTVKNSLRFNSGSSDYLNRTQGTSTAQTKATISFWFKRSILGTTQRLFEGYTASTDAGNGQIEIGTGDQIAFGGFNTDWRKPTQVFRDVSAWYHLIVAFDTTLATANDRVKIYLNGSEITSFTTSNNPTQNSTLGINNNSSVLQIGRRRVVSSNDNFFNGYLSEFYFIDGQQLTPSSFGETDTDTGIWKPKKYTGTFGTNGFYLEFQNSSALGTDSSGNSNTWTVNNLTSIDQTTDTPTNNFATLNPLSQGVTATSRSYTNGNLSITYNGGDDSSLSTMGVSTGKWYAEFKVTAIPTTAIVGVGNESSNLVNDAGSCNIGGSTGEYGYYSNGNKRNNGATATSYGSTYTTNDIIGVALDLNNGAIWFSKNGTWQNSATQAQIEAGTTTNASATGLSGTFFFGTANGASGTTGVAFDNNFGNAPFTIVSGNADGAGYGNFEYAVPSGYYSLCTKNLANFG